MIGHQTKGMNLNQNISSLPCRQPYVGHSTSNILLFFFKTRKLFSRINIIKLIKIVHETDIIPFIKKDLSFIHSSIKYMVKLICSKTSSHMPSLPYMGRLCWTLDFPLTSHLLSFYNFPHKTMINC